MVYKLFGGGERVLKQRDILFKTEDNIFSYRVAGILIRDGRILLQRPINDTGYAFPGGHVSFGETNEETLIREFKEEISADINVHGLQWVAEIFFPWGDKPCHQICLFYRISLCDEMQIPLSGTFNAIDELDSLNIDLEFSWIPLSEIKNIELYPINAKEKLEKLSDKIEHFIYRQ